MRVATKLLLSVAILSMHPAAAVLAFPQAPEPTAQGKASTPPSPLEPAALLEAAQGEAPTALRLSLEDALRRARETSPRLDELRALLSAARARVDGAEAARMPSVDLSARYTRLSGVPELRVPVGGELRTIFPNIPNDVVASASVSLPLYTGGRIDHETEVAERGVEAGLAELEVDEEALELTVTRAWWQLVVAADRERVFRAAIDSFEAHLEDAGNRLQVGLAAPDEPLAVEVELERARLQRLRAESGRRVAQDALAALLDLPPGTAIDPVREDVDVSAADRDVASLVQEAQGLRPERRALQARIAGAEAGTEVARAAERPQVSLSASLDYANPNRRVLPPEADFDTSWQVGVGVTFNAFDGGRREAGVAEALAAAQAARERLRQLERDIRADVVAAWEEMRTAVAAVAVAQRAVESARENLRVASDRYREGVAPSSTRLDAETALLRVELELAADHAAVAVARARLDRAVGR